VRRRSVRIDAVLHIVRILFPFFVCFVSSFFVFRFSITIPFVFRRVSSIRSGARYRIPRVEFLRILNSPIQSCSHHTCRASPPHQHQQYNSLSVWFKPAHYPRTNKSKHLFNCTTNTPTPRLSPRRQTADAASVNTCTYVSTWFTVLLYPSRPRASIPA